MFNVLLRVVDGTLEIERNKTRKRTADPRISVLHPRISNALIRNP